LQNASLADIKKSYRRLSLLWHPDKNSAPDAANKFRQLAAMYEVLKLDTMRAKYDQVLEFGLPDWRQPVFYYRSIRRMPVWEMIIILMLIVTTAQYLMHWGSYMERKMIVVGVRACARAHHMRRRNKLKKNCENKNASYAKATLM
jgi:DnaJ family protein C protein 1